MRAIATGLLTATVLVVGLTSACERDEAGGAPHTRTTAEAENVGSATAEDDAASDSLRFPGTTVTADLTGYDRGRQMINFETVQLAPATGSMEPRYVDVPGDGVHRLPLAPNLKVWSATTICPSDSDTGVSVDAEGRGDQPCTKEQLLAALGGGSGLIAEFKVDTQDQIYEIAELYHP